MFRENPDHFRAKVNQFCTDVMPTRANGWNRLGFKRMPVLRNAVSKFTLGTVPEDPDAMDFLVGMDDDDDDQAGGAL